MTIAAGPSNHRSPARTMTELSFRWDGGGRRTQHDLQPVGEQLWHVRRSRSGMTGLVAAGVLALVECLGGELFRIGGILVGDLGGEVKGQLGAVGSQTAPGGLAAASTAAPKLPPSTWSRARSKRICARFSGCSSSGAEAGDQPPASSTCNSQSGSASAEVSGPAPPTDYPSCRGPRRLPFPAVCPTRGWCARGRRCDRGPRSKAPATPHRRGCVRRPAPPSRRRR